MAVYKGIRALGNVPPEVRSALMGQARALKRLAGRVSRVLPNEATVLRSAGVQQVRGPSAGGRTAAISYGTLADRPTSNFLLARGVGSMVYIAADSGVYWWSGTAWNGPL